MNMTNEIASSQQETAQEIKEIKKQMKEEINGVKTLVASGSRNCNETTLDEVANMVKAIALNQQENAKEIRDLKRLLVSASIETNVTSLETVVMEIRDDVKEVKRLLDASNQTNCDYATVKPSKEALVAALVCEYLVCLKFYDTHSALKSLHCRYI